MSGILGAIEGIAGSLPPTWVLALQKASFAGYEFWCDNATISAGRRLIIHEYPFKDDPYVENIGRATQKITMTGFFNNQDDLVWDQRDTFRSLIQDAPSWDTLVYPSIGSIQAYPSESSFEEGVNVGGGVVRFNITFIIAPDALQEGVDDTQGDLLMAAADANGAFACAFQTIVGGLSATFAAVGEALSAAAMFLIPVLRFVSAATTAFGAVAGIDAVLRGDRTVGLYLGGPLTTPNPAYAAIPAGLSVDQAATAAVQLGVAQVTADRTASLAAIANVTAAAYTLETATYSSAVQAAVSQIVGSTINPVDQVRVLVDSYNALPSNDPFTALIRWSILSEILVAVNAYDLVSLTDVNTLSTTLTPLYDNEINNTTNVVAFIAIRNLKSALVNDLQTRGANLPAVITVTRQTNLPSFVLAYQLYADATRADQLSAMNDVFNPLMFPLTFQALSS